MKCVNHNNVDAVATCNTCGAGLCPTCASMYKPAVCTSCYDDSVANRIGELKASLIKDGIFAVIALLVGLFLMWIGGISYAESWGFILFFAWIPFGWNFLNKITPNIFLILPMVGWVIYFVCKALLSMIVGIFVAPYVIWKKVKEIKQLQQL